MKKLFPAFLCSLAMAGSAAADPGAALSAYDAKKVDLAALRKQIKAMDDKTGSANTAKLVGLLTLAAEKSFYDGRSEDAAGFARRAAFLVEQLAPEAVPDQAHYRLAEILGRVHRLPDAARMARRALAYAEFQFGRDDEHLLAPMASLIANYREMGELNYLRPLGEWGVGIASRGEATRHATGLLWLVSDIYWEQGDEEGAERLKAIESALPLPSKSVAASPIPDKRPAMLDASCHFEYPAEARTYGLTGQARVVVQVAADGVPTAVRMVKSSGWVLLDRAAKAGFATCRFAPAEIKGKPIAYPVELAHDWKMPEGPRIQGLGQLQGGCLPGFFRIAPDDMPSTMRVRFLLNPEGEPFKPVIDSSMLSDGLNERALRFVQSCRFEGGGVGSLRLEWNGQGL